MGSKLWTVVRAMPRLATIGLCAALGLPVAAILAWFLRGSLEHLLVALVPALTVAPVCACGGVLLWFLGLRAGSEQPAGPRLRWLGALLIGLAGFFVVLAPSFLAGMIFNAMDVRDAKAYCMSLVPRLEAYHEEHGQYPAGLSDVMPSDRPLPDLLSGDPFYRRIGSRYEFSILDRSATRGGHLFFSSDYESKGRWETW